MTTKEVVLKRVAHWWRLLSFGYHGLETKPGTLPHELPKIEFSSKLRSTIGRSHRKEKRLQFSLRHMAIATPEEFDEIVAHEVAHCFVDTWHGKHCKHGKEWKEAMEALRLEPRRICRIYLPEGIAACGCGARYIGPIRMKRLRAGTEYVCSKCGDDIKIPDPK